MDEEGVDLVIEHEAFVVSGDAAGEGRHVQVLEVGACFAVDVEEDGGSGASDAPFCCSEGLAAWRFVGECVSGEVAEEGSDLDCVWEEGGGEVPDVCADIWREEGK